MKYITVGDRVRCVCSSCGVRGVCNVQKNIYAQNAFLNAPFSARDVLSPRGEEHF